MRPDRAKKSHRQDTLATGHVSRSSEATSRSLAVTLPVIANLGLRPRIFRGCRATKIRRSSQPAVSRFPLLCAFTAPHRVGSRIKKNLLWGEHPIAPTRFFVLTFRHGRTTILPQPAD